MSSSADCPLFSVITVTFNAEKTIGRTIDSVASQTFDNYEHIVVDGNSSDSTQEIIKSSDNKRITVFSEPDRGLYDAMNKGIGLAKGRYLIFLNAGDKFHSESTLDIIAKTILSNDFPGVVYGQTDIVDDRGNYIGPRHLTAPETLSLDDFKQGMVVCHQAFVVKRDIAPYFNLHYKFSADYEWCIICLMHSEKNVSTGCVLIDYLEGGLTSANHRRSLEERFHIMSTYYGFWPTFFRHFGFALRNFRRKSRNA